MEQGSEEAAAEQTAEDSQQQQDEPQQHDEQLQSTTAVEADADANAEPAVQYYAAEAGTDAACGDDYGAAEQTAQPGYSPAVQYYSAAAGTEAAYATGHGEGGMSHKLTFSGPPYVPKAKPYQRADYSHSTVKLMKIAHDNQVLVKRLTSISHKDPSWVKDLGKTASCNVASSAVNRRKAASTIAQENHALYQRLVAIRPSKDISRETLAAEARRNEAYRANCATFKPKSSPGSNTAATTAAAAGPEYFGTV
uniref:Uncharacterized protein n=1 Tax=Tetradesmus obliquus TaxID=3088 RepID=A0A383WPK5_TETOB|eukprot:jgi/Sobl393_1/1676/SZX78636.1